MDAYEAFHQNIARFIELSAGERDLVNSVLKVTRVRKKQLIVQPGFVCKHKNYIYQGALRAYLIDNDGQDHTISLGVEDYWVSDYNSFVFQEPATLFVEALEDSVIVQLEYHAENHLLASIPAFEKFLRIFTQRSYAFLQRRMLASLSKSAEERYDDFMENYPSIANRVPQYALASFLGMSTEFLSKIRHGKAKKS